jgi:chemotaxis signal transduction protein
MRLFAELQDLVREQSREIAVVVSRADRLFAVTVDEAQAMDKFPPGNIEAAPVVSNGGNGVVRRLARTAKGKDVILLLETDRLLADCGAVAVAG